MAGFSKEKKKKKNILLLGAFYILFPPERNWKFH